MTEKAKKTFQCPDCYEKLGKNEVLDHVRNCKAYRKKYLNNISRTMDVTSKNNLRFLFAELELARQKFVEILSDSDDESTRKILNGNNLKDVEIDAKPINNHNNQSEKRQVKGISLETLQKLSMEEKALNRNNIQENYDVMENYQPQKKTETFTKEKDMKKHQQASLKKQSSYLDSLMSEINHEINHKNEPRFDQDSVECSKCHKRFTMNQVEEFFYGDLCLHPICRKCMDTYMEKEYLKAKGKYKFPCSQKGCKEQIPYYQLAEIYGRKRMEDIDNELNKGFMADLITCVSCKQKFQFIKGKVTDAFSGKDGKPLNDFYKQNFANFRFLCPTCKTQQCKTCQVTPFHLGQTCEQHKISKAQKKCRYCEQPMQLGKNPKSNSNFDDVCTKEDCMKRLKLACTKKLKCGHNCFGFINEKDCVPCLNEKCADQNKKQLNGQNEDSFCNICFIEGLKNGPCIRIKCGHIFHYECLLKKIKTRWFGPRILFNFCLCPLCNKWIEAPQQSELFKILQQSKELENELKDKAVKRLKFENEDKNEKLTNPESPYYKNEQKYAMAIYAYFECWKCKKPYFGGRKNCADAMNDERQGAAQFKPEDLVCPQCVPASGQQVTTCAKHGKQYISYKCKFCCSIAVWFCWGTTHFCDPCHKKQINGEHMAKIPKQKLPKCQGPGKCPVGGNHGGNGDTKSLGCSLCPNIASKKQDF